MKKILICGATGFVGKNITIVLAKNKNYKIHAVRFKRPAYETSKNVIWHKADLRNPNSVDKLIKGMDIVIQAAATTSGSKDIVSKPTAFNCSRGSRVIAWPCIREHAS